MLNVVACRLQQPDLLIHENIQDSFTKLCNRNNYAKLICLVVEIDESNSDWETH